MYLRDIIRPVYPKKPTHHILGTNYFRSCRLLEGRDVPNAKTDTTGLTSKPSHDTDRFVQEPILASDCFFRFIHSRISQQ